MKFRLVLQAMYRTLPGYDQQTIIVSNVPRADLWNYVKSIEDLDVAAPFYIRSVVPC